MFSFSCENIETNFQPRKIVGVPEHFFLHPLFGQSLNKVGDNDLSPHLQGTCALTVNRQKVSSSEERELGMFNQG